MAATAARPGYAQEIVAIARLAVPVAASRIGMLLLVLVDAAMVGRYDSAELAYFGLGNALHLVLLLIGIGMLVGTAVLSAQARGAGEEQSCGRVWRVALLYALVLGGGFALLTLAGEPALTLTGQAPAMAAGGGQVLLLAGLGLPGALVFVCSTLFLEALGRPRPGVAAMLAANVINFLLNLLLIGGGLGLPAMGAAGAALATSVARSVAALGLVLYILTLADRQRWGIVGPLVGAMTIGRKLRRFGYAIGLTQGAESAAFGGLVLLAGLVSPEAVAGYQIAISAVAMAFMGAIGTASATGVRVGLAVGRQDQAGLRRAGFAGLIAIVLFMAVAGSLLLSLPRTVGGLFTSDPLVLAVAVPTLLVGGLMLPTDGMQAVLMGALRGLGDVWVPLALHSAAFFLLMLPLAAWLGLGLGWGAPGLMAGAWVGVSLAALLLGLRFNHISRRPVRRL
ncbi:MAG: MATE family efflux transporter [Alphaproteobacteria bacterium]|nr:MATE family efflux transporter [Alphaproteobacteria bacterium]